MTFPLSHNSFHVVLDSPARRSLGRGNLLQLEESAPLAVDTVDGCARNFWPLRSAFLILFVVTPEQQIKFVKVTGYDHSILEFRFDQEKMDVPLDAKLFQFQVPKGAQLVEDAQ